MPFGRMGRVFCVFLMCPGALLIPVAIWIRRLRVAAAARITEFLSDYRTALLCPVDKVIMKI